MRIEWDYWQYEQLGWLSVEYWALGGNSLTELSFGCQEHLGVLGMGFVL